jgi:multidrug efflux pump
VAALAESLIPDQGGYSVRISGESETFIESGNALFFAYALALLIVYLVLAAQFESFVHPLTILVAVVLSFTGALIALALTGTTLNIYSEIGLVMLVGLVTKNSILIVEFAKMKREEGMSAEDAAIESARLRFRPILMTAFAFLMGVIPLILSSGSGAASRIIMGITVFSGMLVATALGVYLTPAFFTFIESLGRKRTDETLAPVAARTEAHR